MHCPKCGEYHRPLGDEYGSSVCKDCWDKTFNPPEEIEQKTEKHVTGTVIDESQLVTIECGVILPTFPEQLLVAKITGEKYLRVCKIESIVDEVETVTGSVAAESAGEGEECQET